MVATKDTSAPLVVVVGATGNQGGSVVKALIESDKPYRIRALTRDPSKPAAQQLESRGIETHAVTLGAGNEAEIEKAFAGATYAFAVTQFWEHSEMKREVEEGQAIVDAVKKAGVKKFIWSGLNSYKADSNGKYSNVDHFEGKYQITQYAKQQGVPVIVVQAGFFAENFANPMFGPKKDGDGAKYYTVWPKSVKLPIICIKDDYGLFVRAAIEGPYSAGDELVSSSEVLPVGEAITILAEVSGKKIDYVQTSDEQLLEALKQSGMPPHAQVEVSEMILCQRDFGYYGKTPIEPSRKHLARSPLTFRDWAKGQDWAAVF